jgi:hypothetical protein
VFTLLCNIKRKPGYMTNGACDIIFRRKYRTEKTFARREESKKYS